VPAISWIAENVLNPFARRLFLHPVGFLFNERQSQIR